MYRIVLLLFLLLQYINANTSQLTQKEIDFIKTHPIITFGAERDWPPFDFVKNGKHTGIAKDYLDLIEKKTGLKFNYVIDTWENLLKKTKNKQIDLLPMLSKTSQREEYLHFTKSFLTVRDYVFAKKGVNIESIEQLKGKTVAIPKGYVEEEYFKKNYPSIKIYVVNNIIESYDAVITNKADFLVSNLPLINFITKENSLDGINAKFHMAYEGSYNHMAVRKDYPVLRDILQKTLDNITVNEKSIITSKWIDTNTGSVIIDLTADEREFIKNKKKVYIANEYDWLPYDYYENGKPKGYVIDYIKLLLEKVELEPVFITDKWPNLMSRFKNKEIDVLPVISYNEKREEFLNYTNAYIKQKMSIITKKTVNNIIYMDDLEDKKLGLVKNWNSTKIIKTYYPKIKVIEYESLKEVFEALSHNHIDATIQNSMMSTYYINKMNFDNLKLVRHVNIRNLTNELFMGVNKDKKQLLSILNKSILKIEESEIKALNKKWLNVSKTLNFTAEEQKFIDNTVVNISFSGKWAPIGFAVDNKPYGLGFDFWNHILNKTNLKFKINMHNSFDSALESIKTKKSDVIVTTSKIKEREEYSIFSDVYYKAPIGIATLQDQNYISDASKLLGKKIGVDKNSTSHKLLLKYYPKMNFVFVNGVEEGLAQISNNNIFAYIDNMPVLAHNIRKLGHSNIKISGDTGIDFNLQVMMRDDYTLLQSIINKVLLSMTPKEKEDIYNRWSKIEYTKSFDYTVLLKYLLPLIVIIAIILYKNRQLIKYQTNLKETQHELENTLLNFKTLINFTIEGIIITKDNQILYGNNAALKMFDYKFQENLLGINIHKLFDTDKEYDISNIIHNHSSITHELIAKKQNSSLFPVLIKSKSIIFSNEEATIISIIDLSEIKNKENLLIQQSKMASLGEMIANIAHQWRQPLSYISTAASGMKLQKEFKQLSDKDFNDTLKNIVDTTGFLSQTIDDFQNYITNEKQKKDFDINTSINMILNIIKGALVNNYIQVELNLGTNLEVYSYENELNQVLLNILNNSKDALKDIDKDNRFIAIRSYKKENTIYIEVIDNAGGVDSMIIKKVFDPYFTTKHKSQGTGLGLYMTHKIITESMKGDISISNCKYIFEDKRYDKCTKVTITLPIY